MIPLRSQLAFAVAMLAVTACVPAPDADGRQRPEPPDPPRRPPDPEPRIVDLGDGGGLVETRGTAEVPPRTVRERLADMGDPEGYLPHSRADWLLSAFPRMPEPSKEWKGPRKLTRRQRKTQKARSR